ncbi:endo-1,4-beta-xylanase [Roseibacillus persicicus]|uniref:endo-1,4-beta-xylanase n=1 Tax=Roseibacillus persicicus TaxID=454148 RepID=UPI00398ACD4D
MASSLFGATEIVAPEGGQASLSFQGEGTRLLKKDIEGESSWKPIAEMPFSKVYRMDIPKTAKLTNQVQLIVPLERAVQRGDVLLLSFWIRRPSSGGEPGPATVFLQGRKDQQRFQFDFSGYREWQQHVRAFKAPASYVVGKSSLSIHLAKAGPAIEVAGLQLLNYGPDYDLASLPESAVTYRGREVDAPWRKEALARIERIRKGELAIKVVDANGQPVPDAKVQVSMQRHAFGFGNAVNAQIVGAEEKDFPFMNKKAGKEYPVTWEDAQQYRKVLKKYFNSVTFESELRPHVWKLQQGENARWQQRYRVLTEGAVPWLQEQGFEIRGHYLAWGAMDYNALEKEFVGNPEGHREWLWNHMSDILPKTNSYVTEWDTINHIVAWGKHTYEKEYGGTEIFGEIMAEARRLAPQATHAINEGKVLPDGYKRQPYLRVIRAMNEQGQAPDRVGFMAHFGLTSLTPPEDLLEVYDDFAAVAPKLQLSELDVEAGDDEQLQADYFRDVLIASFSHPNFVAIVQWGFWENAHWKPQAALWNADWSLKPAGEVFIDLVMKQWWTDEAVKTGEDGRCQLSGFLGDYEVTVEHNGQSITQQAKLVKEGVSLEIELN